MIKAKKYIDFIFLALLGLSISVSLCLHFTEGFVLSINNYLALLSWIFVLLFKLIKPDKEFFGVLILLLLSTLGVINFTIITVNAELHHSESGFVYNGIGFNIIFFLLLIVYLVMNKRATSYIKILLRGSEKEQEEKRNKMINFYYEKFKVFGDQEFNELINNFDHYPVEAQVALNRIKAEKIN